MGRERGRERGRGGRERESKRERGGRERQREKVKGKKVLWFSLILFSISSYDPIK